MSTALLPAQFLQQVTKVFCDCYSSWNVRLYVNSHTPDKADLPSNYTEASYSTYGDLIWPLINPINNADGYGTFDPINARFTAPAPGDGSITVHGWYVTGSYDYNVVIMAAEFDSPIVLTHGGGDLVFDVSMVDFDNLNP